MAMRANNNTGLGLQILNPTRRAHHNQRRRHTVGLLAWRLGSETGRSWWRLRVVVEFGVLVCGLVRLLMRRVVELGVESGAAWASC